MKKKKKMIDLSKVLIIQFDLFNPACPDVYRFIRLGDGKIRKRRVR